MRATANELIQGGQYQEAADVLNQQLAAAPAGFATERIAALESNLGVVYDKLGRYLEAERAIGKSLVMWKELDMSGTPNYARSLNNLGNVFLNEHKYAKADQAFEDSLAIHRTQESPDQLGMALVISNIGLAKLCLKEYVEAEHLLQESVQTQVRAKKDTINLAAALNNLALTCKYQNRLSDAEQYYSQAIEVWRKVGGPSHPEVGVGLHNLAMLEVATGETDRALEHFQQALEILQSTLPPGHPLQAAALQGYSTLLAKIGRKREAKQLSETARRMVAQHAHDNLEDLSVDVKQFTQSRP